MLARPASLLTLLLAGCAASRAPVDAPSAPSPAARAEPRRPEPGAVLHPAPFTARQIAAATPEGRAYRWRVETPMGITLRDVRFVDVSSEGATVVAEVKDPDTEALVSPPARTPVSWGELEEHGTFPAEATAVTVTEIEVPAGRFEAWRYDVRIETEEGLREMRMWFAPALPGAPVRHEVRQDGRLVSTMVLLEHRVPG